MVPNHSTFTPKLLSSSTEVDDTSTSTEPGYSATYGCFFFADDRGFHEDQVTNCAASGGRITQPPTAGEIEAYINAVLR